ncbi:hypothetical protein Q1695_011363 [Nippostrongylus brasiliensis]|nr:hypothetical protein Q1695_011363 [Nippostrongylus brasiliensis]
MRWDAVVVSTRASQDQKEARREFTFLRECGLFETNNLLVVSDPCDDVGSAGSALNALLIAVEHLCAQNGLSVLNESLLESSKILILLLGAAKDSLPLGASFRRSSLEIIEIPCLLPDYPIVHTIRNINELAKSCNHGVWISGTDTLWKTVTTPTAIYNPNEIAAFYFRGTAEHSLTHGAYVLSEESIVTSLRYRCCPPDDNPNVLLALLYLPPSVSTRFLSLHSVYPISRSTYYGTDSGALGLKLSLFFDVVLATCLGEEEFVASQTATEKSDMNHDVLAQSRRAIWNRFHQLKCRAYCLPLSHYEYLGGDVNMEFSADQEDVICYLEKQVLRRLSAVIVDDEHHCNSIAPLRTLMAISRNYENVIVDVLAELESMCAKSVPRCARGLMLTAEYLTLKADGKGGIRSGPAANPAFTRVFDCFKTGGPREEHVNELFNIVREKWLRTESEMVRAARHFEAAAQICTRIEVERMCRKHFNAISNTVRGPVQPRVTVECAARVDLFGGWLDTPPITLHARPSAVINLAILFDGKKPISCHIRHGSDAGITVKTGETMVYFHTASEIFESCSRPGNPGALVCSCLVCVGVTSTPEDDLERILQSKFGTEGLEIECRSCLPHGSGLGTSSILAAAIIKALGVASAQEYTPKAICHAVLMVEQLLTTGGGWQDQVGCLYSGLKKGFICDVGKGVDVKRIPISDDFEKEINRRLCLIYTGKTRLAKNLLQEVIRGWYSEGTAKEAISLLENNVSAFEDQIRKGIMPCELVETYYKAKKQLASGCEPAMVASLIDGLKSEGLVETAWLAGAGGGGFLYVWLKDGVSIDQLRLFVELKGSPEMTVHTVAVDKEPMRVTLIIT